MLTTHRPDVACERTRTINRLRGRLSSILPVLEGILDFTTRGPLLLVTGFQTAQPIREVRGRASSATIVELAGYTHKWTQPTMGWVRFVRGGLAVPPAKLGVVGVPALG